MEATAGGWMKKQTKSLFANAANKKPGAAGGGTPAAEPSYKRDALSMYQVPPQGEVTIEQFERFAMDRLRVLKGIDEARARGLHGAELEEAIEGLLKEHMPKGAPSERSEYGWRDGVGHHVLRLAYCRTEDLRRWVLAQECEVFRFRFNRLPSAERRAFMRESGLPYEELGRELLAEHREALAQVAMSRRDKEGAAALRSGGDEAASKYFQV